MLILIYTVKGGIKSLVWTDTFQSLFLLLGVVLTAASILNGMDWTLSEGIQQISDSSYSTIFDWVPENKTFFPKQFLSGMFIAIAMTGLDQNMMQKNLSVHTLKDAQKNVLLFSFIVLIVNVIFVSLGALMYLYAEAFNIQITTKTDDLLPLLALDYFGVFAAITFLLGIIAATFSSADSVLTTLTTSLYFDILHLDKRSDLTPEKRKQIRNLIHAAFAFVLLGVILLFRAINNDAVIS